MFRSILPAALLAFAASAFAAETFTGITFTPSSLDSRTALTAVVQGTSSSGCVPVTGAAAISGTTITLALAPPPLLPCIQIPVKWSVPVFLGTLAPGDYTVVTKISATEVDRRVLEIADPDPPFLMQENIGLAGTGGLSTIIRSRGSFALDAATVLFDDQPGTVILRELDHVMVTPPTHAAGAATVKVVASNGTTQTAVNAFHYVDLNAPPDRAAYEPILIPIVFSGPGLLQSMWTTELWVHNDNDHYVMQLNGPFFVIVCVIGPCLQPLQSHYTQKLNYPPSSSPYPSGRVMYVARMSADRLQFSLRVRDTTRQNESHGVEIPVVRHHSSE